MDAFNLGHLTKRTIDNGSDLVVTRGTVWIILSGLVNHITLTDSFLRKYKGQKLARNEVWNTKIDSAVASYGYPLFNTIASVEQLVPGILICEEGDILSFTGGANSFVTLELLEWERY